MTKQEAIEKLRGHRARWSVDEASEKWGAVAKENLDLADLCIAALEREAAAEPKTPTLEEQERELREYCQNVPGGLRCPPFLAAADTLRTLREEGGKLLAGLKYVGCYSADDDGAINLLRKLGVVPS